MSEHWNITWEMLTLKLRNPFKLSYGTSETRQAFWLKLNGDEGWGEGTIPPYYRVDPTAMTDCWKAAGQQRIALPETVDAIAAAIPDGPAPARSALELALLDRIGKRQGVPLYKLLGLKKPPVLTSCFTISMEPPETMATMAKQVADYSIIKLKLGSDNDEARVKAVREARPDVKLCVDANAGWTLEQALANLKWLEKYNLELIEQPLGRDKHHDLGVLQRATKIPIVADESVQTMEDVELLGAAGIKGINVKLMKVGGILSALKVLKRAQELKMRIMLGCMIETSIGITAMAHLASFADWLDLDAPVLISNDPFDGMIFDRNAKIHVPERPGIGAIRKVEALA